MDVSKYTRPVDQVDDIGRTIARPDVRARRGGRTFDASHTKPSDGILPSDCANEATERETHVDEVS